MIWLTPTAATSAASRSTTWSTWRSSSAGTGKAVIGSREKQKWIKEYDTYEFDSKSWKLTETFFVKIDTWLNGELKSHCKEHPWHKFLGEKHAKTPCSSWSRQRTERADCCKQDPEDCKVMGCGEPIH